MQMEVWITCNYHYYHYYHISNHYSYVQIGHKAFLDPITRYITSGRMYMYFKIISLLLSQNMCLLFFVHNQDDKYYILNVLSMRGQWFVNCSDNDNYFWRYSNREAIILGTFWCPEKQSFLGHFGVQRSNHSGDILVSREAIILGTFWCPEKQSFWGSSIHVVDKQSLCFVTFQCRSNPSWGHFNG